MSRMITSGASKPNGAGLPMFSLRMRWPSASSREACWCTGSTDLVQDVLQLGGLRERPLPRCCPVCQGS